MGNFFPYLYAFVIGEAIAIIVFPILRRSIAGAAVFKSPDIETFKGVLERLVIFLGLINDYSSIVVMFGALKIATRLHDEANKNISNNYFLIGNFLSVLIAVATAVAAKHWTH